MSRHEIHPFLSRQKLLNHDKTLMSRVQRHVTRLVPCRAHALTLSCALLYGSGRVVLGHVRLIETEYSQSRQKLGNGQWPTPFLPTPFPPVLHTVKLIENFLIATRLLEYGKLTKMYSLYKKEFNYKLQQKLDLQPRFLQKQK